MLLPVAPSPVAPSPAALRGLDRLQAVIGGCLGIDLTGVDPRTPLTACGLDSLKALEVVGALEDAYGCTLPEWLLLDCPDLATVGEAIDRLSGRGGDAPTPSTTMRADAVLPDDIAPAGISHPDAGVRRILLTGATGFLGAWLARTLLDRTDARLLCLARPSSSGPVDRVRGNLEQYGLWRPGDARRVHGIAGDLSRPSLGLESSTFQALAGAVDAIYHAAADVNWVTPYAALRSANVTGTSELLRLACTGSPKPFHFVSSLAVCYAVGGPAEVVEAADMLPFAERLPLGYAQSKCVAEALVREAARRGLPATIFRPALLAGDSSTGASNIDDLIAALLKGCIQMQAAPDLDWTFDAAPVDVAAEAIVRLATAPSSAASASPGLQTFHLRHPRPRHWRECVLWANLFGYDLRLEPYTAWLRRLDREAHRSEHPLHRLRGFFLRRVEGRTVPEHYQTDSRSQVDCSEARRAEDACGVKYPPLDADLLHRYFEDYIRRGYLAPPPRRARSSTRGAARAAWQTAVHFERLLRTSLADPTLRVTSLDLIGRGSDHSVVSELTAWRRGQQVGLFHHRLGLCQRGAARTLDVMVKVKPSDDDVLEVAETMAAVCDARVNVALRDVRDLIGIRGSHVREPVLYEEADDRIRRYMPRCYGTWRDNDEGSWGLVLERLTDMAVIDAVDDPQCWTAEAIQSVIAGLAAIHAVWLGRDAELGEMPWIGHVSTSNDVSRLQPFWEALASHAASRFQQWAGVDVVRVHDRLVRSVPEWRGALDSHPRTLIHNDFNPRNIALRRDAGRLRLVAYDWELATVGVPQRDLAEFLCFVLPEDVSLARVTAAVDAHRGQLERLSGTPLDAGRWRAGFMDALSEVLVARLAFYALIDRVRPQPFLPRVVRTWLRLHTLSSRWSG